MGKIVKHPPDNAAMVRRCFAVLAALLIAGCSPTLDWREFVPEGSGISASFPCRPDRHARPVAMAGATVRLEMLVCSAGDATYALSFLDSPDAGRVSALLDDWRAITVRNVQGAAPQLAPVNVPGMTPNARATRLVVAGRLPDGSAVQQHAAFFAHGLRVYAATVIGAKPQAAAVETFFSALRFPG